MSDDEAEATHCFSFQGNKIYVVIDDDTTEVDLAEALVENLELSSTPICFCESKYETFISLKFVILHRNCLSLEYGSMEAIQEKANKDISEETDLEKILQTTKTGNPHQKNNAMRMLCLLGRNDSLCPLMIKHGIIPIIVQYLNSTDTDLQTAACGVVLNLAYEDEIKEKLAEVGIIPNLAKMLHSDIVTLHRAAAGAIRNIACDNDAIITQISDCNGVIDRLIKLLDAPLLDVKAVAAAALRNLAAKESLRKTIAVKGALNSLMQLIQVQNEEVQRGAAGCLAYLAEDRTIRDQISRQDAVSALLPLLMMNSNDEQLLASTARAIAKLALDDTNCIEIGKKGGIPVFVRLLDSTSSEVLRWACNAIYNLAVHDLNSRLLGESKAIPILIKLLQHEDIEVKKNAIGALWNLSAGDENAVRIMAGGGGLPIVQMLDSTNLEIVRRALPTVGNIARHSALKEDLANLGAVSKALTWLKNTVHEEIQDNAAFVLQGLAALESASKEVVISAGIETILEVMKQAKPSLCLALGNALLALSFYETPKVEISRVGGIQILIDLLQSTNIEILMIVQPILGSLAFNDAISLEIAQKGAIPFLITNLKSNNKKVQYAALDAIANLSSDETTRAAIVESDGIDTLVQLLSAKATVTVECACRTLLNIASEESYIPLLLENKIISKIKPLTKSQDKDVKKNAVCTLRNLSSIDSSIENFHSEEALPYLIEVLQENESNLDLTKPALESLVNLSADDRIPSEITKVVNGVSTIINYLSSPDLESQGYAAVIICNIARNPDLLYTISKRAIASLLHLTKHSNVFGQTQAAAALHYLAQHESNKVEMCNSEDFLLLFGLLEENDERARNAGWTLEQLVSNAQCITTIVAKCGIPKLVKFLTSNNEDVKNALLFVVYKALRADLNLRTDIKEAGATSALQAIAQTGEKRTASFATYMLQVISK